MMMAGAACEPSILPQFLQAVDENKGDDEIRKILGHRDVSSSSLTEPLLRSSSRARLALAELFAGATSPSAAARPRTRILRSLLRSPSKYELPWEAACRAVHQLCSSVDVTPADVHATTSEIQAFVQLAVSVWLEEERKLLFSGGDEVSRSAASTNETPSTRTPRAWLLRLMTVIVEPTRRAAQPDAADALDTAAMPSIEKETWRLPLGILPLLAMVSRDLDPTMLDSCLDLVCCRSVRLPFLASWLRVASDLAPYLRETDWANFRKFTLRELSHHDVFVAGFEQPLPDILRAALSLSSWVLKAGFTNGDELMSWQGLILRILVLAGQHDLELYSRMEGSLRANLEALSAHSLQVWTRHFVRIPVSVEEMPSWVLCNVLLIIRSVSRETGAKMVARLVSKAFGGGSDQGGDVDVDVLCRSRLLQYLCPAATPSSRTKGRPKSSTRSLSPGIDELLRGVSYAGSGCFHNNEGTAVELLCNAGRTVTRSLLPTQEALSSSLRDHATDRGKAWMSTVLEIIEDEMMGDSQTEYIIAVTIATSTFLELPAIRGTMVRSLLECMVRDSDMIASREEKLWVVVAIIRIVSARLDIVNDAPELDGFKALFTDHRLPLSLILAVFESLQSLQSVKDASLRSAQNVIESPSLHPLVWECGQLTDKHLDRITFSLHSLTGITSKSRWKDVEYRAWSLLYDVIVGSKSIPVSSRSWLYDRIQNIVETGTLHRSTAMHYLRALVARLLVFIECNDQNFDVPRNTSGTREACFENFEGLLQTIFALIYFSAEESRAVSTIKEWRSLIRKLIQGESRSIADCTDLLTIDVDPSIHATFYSVYFLLRQLLNQHHSSPEVDGESTHFLREKVRMREELALSGTSERPTCITNRITPVATSTGSGDSDWSRAESLCNAVYLLLVNFLTGPEWAGLLGATETPKFGDVRRLVVGICGMFVARRCPAVESSQTQLSTLCKALCAFCELGLPVLDSVLSVEEELASLDIILSFVLQVCDTVHAASLSIRSLNDKLLVQVSTTLWDLHMRISEERSSTRLVHFLEKTSLGHDPVTHPVRIGPIETLADIDCTVREVRYRTVRALVCCLQGLIKPSEASLDQVITSFEDESPPPRSLLDTRMALTWLEVFSVDLSQGIQGQSGGISYELFVVYLRCIEACAEHLKLRIHSGSQLICLRKLVIRTARASDALDIVLSTVGLKGSSALRKALALSTYTLPSLAAYAARSMAYTSQPLTIDLTDLNSVCLTRYLFQCRKILDRSIEFTMTQCFAPWETIAGVSHVSESGVLSGETLDSEEESFLPPDDAGFARPQTQKNSYRLHERGKPDSRSIQLHSERAWGWALCALIQSAEDYLQDSIQLLQDSKSAFRLKSNLTLLLQHRASQITVVSAGIGAFFDVTEKESALAEDAGHGHPPECRRMLSLPPAAKLRLVAFVDRFLAALQRSLALIISFLRRPYESNISLNSCTVEALVHLHCWLIQVEDCSTCDPCVGVLTWFALERAVTLEVPKKGTEAFHDGSIVQKIRKTVIRAEQLEVSLGRLHQELAALDDESEQPTVKSLCKQRMLGVLAKQLRTLSSRDRESKLTLQVSKKLKELANCRRLFSINETETGKRRWSDSDRASLGRQRNMRSRNRVIDEWLQLDCSIGQDETLEEDAYADLEDFLE